MFLLPCLNTPFLDDVGSGRRIPSGHRPTALFLIRFCIGRVNCRLHIRSVESARFVLNDRLVLQSDGFSQKSGKGGTYIMLSKNSMVLESSVSVTIAFFHSPVLPMW